MLSGCGAVSLPKPLKAVLGKGWCSGPRAGPPAPTWGFRAFRAFADGGKGSRLAPSPSGPTLPEHAHVCLYSLPSE